MAQLKDNGDRVALLESQLKKFGCLAFSLPAASKSIKQGIQVSGRKLAICSCNERLHAIITKPSAEADGYYRDVRACLKGDDNCRMQQMRHRNQKQNKCQPLRSRDRAHLQVSLQCHQRCKLLSLARLLTSQNSS